MSELAKALAAAQSDFPAIERTRDVRVQTKTGGSYTFAYAPLDAIVSKVQPVLKKHALSFSQLLDNVDGKPALRTSLLHEGGEVIEGVCPLPINGEHLSAQEFGSLVTYMRRYALVALLGIATEEDDDGNHASGNTVDTNGHEPFTPTEPFKPSEFVVHWSKHRGKKLGELSAASLKWFATEWQMQDEPTEADHLMKAAAVALHSGDDSPITPDPYPDVPFS